VFVVYFASHYLRYFSFLHAVATFVVKVKRHSQLCEGQPLCHSTLQCCLVHNEVLYVQFTFHYFSLFALFLMICLKAVCLPMPLASSVQTFAVRLMTFALSAGSYCRVVMNWLQSECNSNTGPTTYLKLY